MDPKPAGVEGRRHLPASEWLRVRTRYQSLLDGLPSQEDEPGAAGELVQEVADWAPYRARANRLLLGDDDQGEP